MTELDFRSFAFIITLAAVINGLGIVRWVAGFSQYLSKGQSLQVVHYWVFNLWAAAQFLLHILLWWSLWGVREAENFNFLTYLYVLLGPVLLYLGTSLLAPNLDEDIVDLRKRYFKARRAYFSVSSLLWLWALLVSPVLYGRFGDGVAMLVAFMAVTVSLRLTSDPRMHAGLAVLNWLLLATYIGTFAMDLNAPV